MNIVHRYLSFLYWFIPDAILRFRWLSVLVLVAGFLGVAFQVASFAMIVFYARHFSAGEMVSLNLLSWSAEFDPRTSVFLLAFSGGATLICLLISSVMIYISRRNIIRMSRFYIEFCTRRIIELLAQNQIVHAEAFADSEFAKDKFLQRLAIGDARICGRILRLLLELVIPLLSFIVAFIVLIYLEPGLTGIIILCGFGYIYYQYHISIRAADYTIQLENLMPLTTRKTRSLIRYYKMAPPSLPVSIKPINDLFGADDMRNQFEAYEGRIRIIAESHLASGIFMSFVLAIILLYMGSEIIRIGTGWGELLIYLVALRYAMTGMVNVFGQITSINRFYPRIRRYYLYLHSFNDKPSDEVTECPELRLETDSPELSGSRQKVTLINGDLISVLSSISPNRYTMGILLGKIFNNKGSDIVDILHATRFVTGDNSCSDCSINEFIGLNRRLDMEEESDSFDIIQKLRSVDIGNLEEKLSPKKWRDIDAELKFILSLYSAVTSKCAVVLIDGKNMKNGQENLLAETIGKFRDKVYIIIFDLQTNMAGSYAEDYIAVLGQKKMAGVGSREWYVSVKEKISGILSRDGTSKNSAQDYAFADDESNDELSEEF